MSAIVIRRRPIEPFVISKASKLSKLSKDAVSFEHPGKGADFCLDCRYFKSAANACEIVEGRVEAPDWCDRFSRRSYIETKTRALSGVTKIEVVRLPYFTFQKLHVEAQHHRDALAKHVHSFLDSMAEELAKKIEHRAKKVKKANDDEDAIFDDIDDLDFSDLGKDASIDLTKLAQEYGDRGLTQLGIANDEMFRVVNKRARNWAMFRGAELVGLKWNDDGELVPNDDAKWNIDETTREDLREIVTEAFEQETSMSALADQIRDAGTFSQTRANAIAVTETSRAQAEGSLTAWDESGLVDEVSVMLSYDHTDEDECDDVADDGPYSVLEALGLVPIHPNCECTVVATKIKGGFEMKVAKRRSEECQVN